MKRVISMMLASAALCSALVGCGGKQSDTEPTGTSEPVDVTVPTGTTQMTEAPDQTQSPSSAQEVLESIWNRIPEDQRFWVVGGDYNSPVDNAPGAVNLSVTDYLTTSLVVPEAQLATIREAASVMHAMNANNFTCGVYLVEDADTFVAEMKDAILGNQWICGMPEMLKIADLGGGYVLVAFGISDAMDPFFAQVEEAYPQTIVLIDESVT